MLKSVNLTVGQGELFEVTGPSGSGKTTLLRLVHGQLRPNAGELWVRGRGLHRFWRRGLGGLRRDVAFVFQEQRLLPRLTAFENIVLAIQIRDPQLPHRTIKHRATEALGQCGRGLVEQAGAAAGAARERAQRPNGVDNRTANTLQRVGFEAHPLVGVEAIDGMQQTDCSSREDVI